MNHLNAYRPDLGSTSFWLVLWGLLIYSTLGGEGLWPQVARMAAVTGIVGWGTNWMVIQMLFHPSRAWKIGPWTVPFTPGLLIHRKEALAKNIGIQVSETLLSREALEAQLQSAQSYRYIRDILSDFPGTLQKWIGSPADIFSELLSQGPLRHNLGASIASLLEALAGVSGRQFLEEYIPNWQEKLQRLISRLQNEDPHMAKEVAKILLSHALPQNSSRMQTLQTAYWIHGNSFRKLIKSGIIEVLKNFQANNAIDPHWDAFLNEFIHKHVIEPQSWLVRTWLEHFGNDGAITSKAKKRFVPALIDHVENSGDFDKWLDEILRPSSSSSITACLFHSLAHPEVQGRLGQLLGDLLVQSMHSMDLASALQHWCRSPRSALRAESLGELLGLSRKDYENFAEQILHQLAKLTPSLNVNTHPENISSTRHQPHLDRLALLLKETAATALPSVLKAIEIDRIVEDTIRAYNPQQLEGLVRQTTNHELRSIIQLGGWLGMLAGAALALTI